MDREPFIGVASGFLTQHRRDHIKVLGLDLPCSDGERLASVVSAHIEIARGAEIETILPDCPVEPYSE